MRTHSSVILLACTLLMAGAGAAGAAGRDPIEPWNRRVHAFNLTVQLSVLAPVARRYTEILPADLQRGISNALSNLGEPVSVLSGLGAGNVDLARHAAARFAINTTLGLAGVRDRARELGYERQAFALADTLCNWGVPSGPFLMLPVVGPSNLRDAAGRLTTGLVLSQVLGADVTLGWGAGEAFVGYADVHDELARIETGALDPYAVMRSAYAQRRARVRAVDQAAALPGDDQALD